MIIRTATLCLIGTLIVAGPALARSAGSFGLSSPGMGMSTGGATPTARPTASPLMAPPVLTPPPAFVPAVPQLGSSSISGAASNPVDQQKQALYRSQLQSYQRQVAGPPGGTPSSAADALVANQALNQLALQPDN